MLISRIRHIGRQVPKKYEIPLKFLKNSLEAINAWLTSMTEKSELVIDFEWSEHTYIKNLR